MKALARHLRLLLTLSLVLGGQSDFQGDPKTLSIHHMSLIPCLCVADITLARIRMAAKHAKIASKRV